MMSPWNLIYPRHALFLATGKPLRFIGFMVSVLIFIFFCVLVSFALVILPGRFSVGPFVEIAARENDWSSALLGMAACVLFAWLMWRSIRSQSRNFADRLPSIEGRVDEIVEIDEWYGDGRGHVLGVKIRGKEYLLPIRLKKYLQAGVTVRIALWAPSEKVRAVWVAW